MRPTIFKRNVLSDKTLILATSKAKAGNTFYLKNNELIYWLSSDETGDAYIIYDSSDNLSIANLQTSGEIFIVIATATDTQIPIQFREDPVTAEDLQVVFPVETRLTAPKIIIDHGGTYAYTYVPLSAPLTSTSWDGDSKTSANNGIIDLSSVFGAPAGIKAVQVKIFCTVSAASSYIYFGPTSSNPNQLLAIGNAASDNVDQTGIVNCDSNGDIYVTVQGTVSSTILQIWGYYI